MLVVVVFLVTETCRSVLAGACSGDELADHCPSGWTEVDVDSCMAPLSYTGPCSVVLTIDPDAATSSKRLIAEKCAVSWPCIDCVPNYEDAACPMGWSATSEDICEPPLSLDGQCAGPQRVGGAQNKRELGARCGHVAAFPCMDPCEKQHYGLPCPQGWYSLDGYCVAPRAYTGPCLSFQNLAGLSQEEKKAWSRACRAPFPCPVTSVSGSVPCEPKSPCPDGWKRVGVSTEYCQADADYQGPCRPVVAIAEIANTGHTPFAEACAVAWSECASVVVEDGVPTLGLEARPEAPSGLAGPIADDGTLLVAR